MRSKVRKLKKGYKYILLMFSLVCFCGCDILNSSPRNPNHEVPITYNIGWWPYQKDLKIEGLDIEILESELNLFNSKSLIAYKISGHLFSSKNWEANIEQIHIAEYLNKDTIDDSYDRVIEITPVVKVSENKKQKEEFKPFTVYNEHTVTSNSWGINSIKVICGDKEQIIKLHQKK